MQDRLPRRAHVRRWSMMGVPATPKHRSSIDLGGDRVILPQHTVACQFPQVYGALASEWRAPRLTAAMHSPFIWLFHVPGKLFVLHSWCSGYLESIKRS